MQLLVCAMEASQTARRQMRPRLLLAFYLASAKSYSTTHTVITAFCPHRRSRLRRSQILEATGDRLHEMEFRRARLRREKANIPIGDLDGMQYLHVHLDHLYTTTLQYILIPVHPRLH